MIFCLWGNFPRLVPAMTTAVVKLCLCVYVMCVYDLYVCVSVCVTIYVYMPISIGGQIVRGRDEAPPAKRALEGCPNGGHPQVMR